MQPWSGICLAARPGGPSLFRFCIAFVAFMQLNMPMPDRAGSRSPAPHNRGWLRGGVLLFLTFSAAAQAASLPEEALLAGIAGDMRHPGLRCEWIAARFDTLDEQLSLYREEITGFHVLVDGRKVGDSAGRVVLAVEFEARLAGPATATVALDAARAPLATTLAAGQRVEIHFGDRSGRLHPLFCGELAFLRSDPRSSRVDLVAAMPRTGAEGRTNGLWQNMTCAEVIEQQAESAGLEVYLRLYRTPVRLASITRTRQAAWPFMRALARQCRYDIVLQPGGTIAVTESSFTAPAPVSQQWSNLTLPEVAKRLADSLGRTPNLQLRGTYERTGVLQQVPNEEFLASLAPKMRVSLWYVPTAMLYLREDGVWNATATAPPAGGGDTVLWRITATGGTARSFTRRPADPAALAADPERVPLMQVTLLLGNSMVAALLPRLPLADRAMTAAKLDAAIARLAQASGVTPERRFLQAYAQAHRPTLIHLFRLRPGGLQILDAIGR